MTPSDYIEKYLGIELLDCQKNMINELEKLQRNQKIYLIYPPKLGRTCLEQIREAIKMYLMTSVIERGKFYESL